MSKLMLTNLTGKDVGYYSCVNSILQPENFHTSDLRKKDLADSIYIFVNGIVFL